MVLSWLVTLLIKPWWLKWLFMSVVFDDHMPRKLWFSHIFSPEKLSIKASKLLSLLASLSCLVLCTTIMLMFPSDIEALVISNTFAINSQVLEAMLGGEIDEERWKMPEEEEEQEEFWGFDDLECESDTSFSTSPHDSISTRSIS